MILLCRATCDFFKNNYMIFLIIEILTRRYGLESRDYGRRDSSYWSRDTLSPQKLALTSLTSSDRSVGIVRSQIQTTEFLIKKIYVHYYVVTHAIVLPLTASLMAYVMWTGPEDEVW
jgi:hypothetical protein